MSALLSRSDFKIVCHYTCIAHVQTNPVNLLCVDQRTTIFCLYAPFNYGGFEYHHNGGER